MLQVPDWTKDSAAGRLILQHHGLEVFESSLHLEGGSIHTDGEGYVSSPRPSRVQYLCMLFEEFTIDYASRRQVGRFHA